MDDPSHYQNPSYYFRYNARGDASFIANDDSEPGASGGDTLTYDQENRLTSITVDANANMYVYDGDENRVKKTGNGISAFYVGNYYDGASSHTPRRDGRHVCSCNNTSAQTALRAVVPPGIYKEKRGRAVRVLLHFLPTYRYCSILLRNLKVHFHRHGNFILSRFHRTRAAGGFGYRIVGAFDDGLKAAGQFADDCDFANLDACSRRQRLRFSHRILHRQRARFFFCFRRIVHREHDAVDGIRARRNRGVQHLAHIRNVANFYGHDVGHVIAGDFRRLAFFGRIGNRIHAVTAGLNVLGVNALRFDGINHRSHLVGRLFRRFGKRRRGNVNADRRNRRIRRHEHAAGSRYANVRARRGGRWILRVRGICNVLRQACDDGNDGERADCHEQRRGKFCCTIQGSRSYSAISKRISTLTLTSSEPA